MNLIDGVVGCHFLGDGESFDQQDTAGYLRGIQRSSPDD